jgi:O-antigen/teichoic acid export membrane protein
MFTRSLASSLRNPFILDLARLAPMYLIPGIASFVSAPILFALLGASEYGVLALAGAISLGIPYLTASWVESTTIRFGHIRQPSRFAAGASLLASGVAGALAAAVVLRDQPPILWIEVGALTASIGGYLLRSAHLQSMMRFAEVSRLAAARAVVGSALAVVLGAVTRSSTGAVLGFVIGYVVVTTLTTRATRELEPARPAAGSPDLSGARLFGLASMGVAIGLYLLSAGDRFVLNAFRPLSEVGVYAISYTLTEMVMRLMPSVLTVVMRPRVFRLWDAAETTRARALIGAAIALLLWAGGWVQIAWLTIVQLVTTSVDPQVAGPVSIGITSLSIAFSISLLLTAGLAQTRLALTTVTCAILAIAANIALVPTLGVVGAALVTAAAYTALMLVHWAGARLRLGRRETVVAAVAFASIAANGLLTLVDTQVGLVVGAVSLAAITPYAVGTLREVMAGSRSAAP